MSVDQWVAGSILNAVVYLGKGLNHTALNKPALVSMQYMFCVI